MFLSKLALYGGVAGTFFAVSAFSTVQITKQMNKIPVPNGVESEEDEEEELFVRQMSDTEKFINSLTAFGNMEGNLNVNVTKDDYTLAINGDVFVSMESMDNIMFDASLAVTTLGHTFNIGATYIDNTVFATIEGNNLKLKTSDINEITSLFSTMESSIELPDTFKNIDTNSLITNLSAMKAEKSEDKITYTCNLIEGIPPIIFTSDLDYNMTGVSLSNFEIEGFKINVNATTKILGKGHNRVTNPETSEKVYTDVSSYFGVIKQVSNLINTQEAGLTYNINLTKGSSSLISTTGNANVRIKNGLDLVVNGQLNNSDNSKHVNYTLGYQNNNAFLNFNDLIKVYYDVNNFSNLKSSVKALINNPDIATLISNLESVELPIVKMINEKDYNGLIDNYKGLFLSKDQIKLSVSNSLFSNDSSNIDIVINLNENGIKDVNISNLRYSDYALSLSVAINEYHNEAIDLSTYRNVSNIDKIIDQVNKLITDKSFNITINNLSYGDLSVNGYIQVDLINKIYQADVSINKEYINEDDEVAYHTYHIRLDTDATNYYLAYNDEKTDSDVKIAISKDSVTSIITDVKNFLANKDSELMNLASYLLDKFNVNIALPEVKIDTNINVLDLLFEDYIKSVDMSNESSINIVVNGSKLALDNDINLAIGLNEDSTISGLSGNLKINAKNLEFNVNLNDFNKNIAPFDASEKAPYIVNGNTNEGGWIGMSDISNAVKYVTTLDNETQLAISNQVKDIIENKQVGVNYGINVFKKANNSNELIFNMNGDLDLKINDVNDINSYLISLSGNMINEDELKALDSNVDIKLYEGKLYFNYNDKLKLAYGVDDIKDLVSIIKSKITNNTTTEVSEVLNQLFPSGSDTSTAPLISIINNKNYASIINYYKGAYIDNDNKLNVVIDGSLIGNANTDIVIKLKADNNGISNITLNGVYALGYTLDFNLDFTSYHDVTMSEEEKTSYTDLKYINNIFDKVANLVNKDKFALTLSGNLNLGKGDITINGNSYVSLSEANDFGVAELNITNNNKTHNVKIDVNRNKVSKDATQEEKDNALRTSKVLFSYNNNLNGSLNLKSLIETFDLIKTLASDGNPLLDKIKGLLTRDTTESTITKIMNGEPEAILYDNSLEAINYDVDALGYHYDIVLNGNLLKSDEEDTVEPIHIYINLDDNHEFTGIGIKGRLNTYTLDIDLGIEEASSNTMSWNRLTKNSSYYDFSDIKTLVEYLFNTGTKKDFSLSGTISANVIDIFSVANINMNAKVHIDSNNKTTAVIEINNIPQISYLLGAIKVSDDDWDYRKTTIYLTDEEVYIYVYYYDDYTNWGDWAKTYRKTTTKWVKLSMSEFADDIAYYLVNYSLGVTTGSIAGKSLDMRNQTSSSDKDIDYSKILSSYNFTNNGTPTWTLGINLAELAGSNMLDTLNATITGNNDTKLLSSVHASTALAGLVNATIDASLDSTDYIGDATVNAINAYLEAHKTDTNKHSYSNVTDMKK